MIDTAEMRKEASDLRACGIRYAAWLIDAAATEIERLREEVVETLTDMVQQECRMHDDGLYSDMALSTYEYAIARLVQLGVMRKVSDIPERYDFIPREERDALKPEAVSNG